jgi:hypothetical protein
MVNYELVNLIVSSISTILAGIAILLYIIMWNKEKESSNYDIFDTTYLDILKTGMEYPKFRNPNYTKNYKNESDENEIIRYELYAFICWNFCETIIDKGDKALFETWGVAIEVEKSLHETWFNAEENRNKFKDSFRDKINQTNIYR